MMDNIMRGRINVQIMNIMHEDYDLFRSLPSTYAINIMLIFFLTFMMMEDDYLTEKES